LIGLGNRLRSAIEGCRERVMVGFGVQVGKTQKSGTHDQRVGSEKSFAKRRGLLAQRLRLVIIFRQMIKTGQVVGVGCNEFVSTSATARDFSQRSPNAHLFADRCVGRLLADETLAADGSIGGVMAFQRP